MNIERGFMVSEAMVPMLKDLPAQYRNQILGAAFEMACGLKKETKPDDPTGALMAIVRGIVENAKRFEERGDKKREAEKEKKRRQRAKLSPSVPVCPEGRNGTERDKTGCKGTNGLSPTIEKKRSEVKGSEESAEDVSPGTHTPTPETSTPNLPSLEAVMSHAEIHFAAPRPTREFLAEWYGRMQEGGWKDKHGRLLDHGRWQRELSAWWNQEKKFPARAPTAAGPEPVTGTGRGPIPVTSAAALASVE